MTDYSEQFDKERKYRVEVSHHKYGSARKNAWMPLQRQSGALMHSRRITTPSILWMPQII